MTIYMCLTTSALLGGYTASCAAMSYPDIGAVVSYRLPALLSYQWTTGYTFLPQIIDASFDELFPLVKTRVTPHLRKLIAILYYCVSTFACLTCTSYTGGA